MGHDRTIRENGIVASRHKYARLHPDRVQESRRKYRESHRAKRNEYNREWAQKNRVKRRAYLRGWYNANKQRVSTTRRLRRVNYPEQTLMVNEKTRAWYAAHREDLKAKARARNRNARMLVFAHYCNGRVACACCGESILDFLTIDHVNQDGKLHREAVGTGYAVYFDIIKNCFPVGYQVLCMNCNTARSRRGNKGVCPHKRVMPKSI